MRALTTFALAILVGCGWDSLPATTFGRLGVWTLQSFDDDTLPYPVIQEPGETVEIVSDVLTFGDIGRFSQITNFRTMTTDGVVTPYSGDDSGTWILSGREVTLSSERDGSVRTGTVDGNTLTITRRGQAGTWFYRRQ